MTKKQHSASVELLRERTLYLYSTAVEEGDLDTMAQVLKQAEADPILEQLILEIDAYHQSELDVAEDAETVRELLVKHVPSGAEPVEVHEPAPLTVGDVVHKLKLDNKVPQTDQAALLDLQDRSTPLPARLGLKEVMRLGSALGVRASERFWRLFRETALLLGLSSSKQQASYAAARRQRRPKAGDGEGGNP